PAGESSWGLPLVLLVFLASGSWEQQAELLQILEGEEVSVRCNYRVQRAVKTWCRVTSARTCIPLVTHPRPLAETGDPRFIIRDYPQWGFFIVTMTLLRVKDSGLYLCRIYESSQIINLRAIRLAVSPAPTPPTTTTTKTTRTTGTTGTTAGTSAISPVIDSVMVVLLLLLVLALLVILYFWQRRRARADSVVDSCDPYSGHLSAFDSQGSDKQLGSGKDTGDIHYASFTHLDPFSLEDPIYINTRPGLRPTPDPFLTVEYASITKN
uniref:Ig-like domain-containing protein n=1 Tax=Myotis lucifugus TaxID=59463 RepID=G1QFN6_MYOLU